MYKVNNFFQNDDADVVAQLGGFSVVQWKRDMSVDTMSAQDAWFSSQMNVRRRQVVCDLTKGPVCVQGGAMQWSVGEVVATTGVKGVGDFLGKAVRAKVTNDSLIKPEYKGTGMLVLEPTYSYILLLNVQDWGGSVVIDEGSFLACDADLRQEIVMRSNVSSAVAGGEGLFNLGLRGSGVACLASPCPREELIQVDLRDDVLRIDGNMAVAWSGSLSFTVERSSKTLLGSAVSGEGLVNVYRGTGSVLMSPTVYVGPFFQRPPEE